MAKKNAKPRKILRSLIFIGLIGLGILAGAFIYTAQNLPVFDPHQLAGAESTLIYDDKGNLVATLHAAENRTEVTLDKIPPHLINAFIATEDRDFYEHHGVNFKGIMRAVIVNITSGNPTGQGASTITQQLARNAFLSFEKSWERKLKEILLAFKIESKYSKDEILCMYLNKIYFGSGAYGVQAASNTYFGKDVSELNLAEAALLAGLPQSPNYYNPFQNLEAAKARQKIVLNNMVKCGYIDEETAEEAYAEPLVFKSSFNNEAFKYGYFIDAVTDEAIKILSSLKIYDNPHDAIYKAGLKIYTTMDSELQSYAEQVYANPANFPNQSAKGEQIQSAMAVIDHHNGEVKAIIGGRKYEQRRGFNRATSAYRQPGSSIKPLTVYSPALEAGYMPFYVLDDSPISFKTASGIWSPRNYDGKYRGLITMRTAVQWSINTYAVQLLDKIGVRTGFDFGRALGLPLIDSPGANDLGLAQLALGGLTKGVTPLQMAAAYGAIANGGIYYPPHFITKIVDEHGVEIYTYKPSAKRVMSPQTSWLMTNMLETVVNSGTGTRAKVPGIMTAGKTGTSEEYKDSWFCGFTPGYACAVWMGYDKDHTMNRVYGGSYPAGIFRQVLTKAHEGYHPKPKAIPPDIVKVSICLKSGKLASEICPEGQVVSEYARKDAVPAEVCDIHEAVYICPESGKLAGKYCPNPQVKVMVRAAEGSSDPDKMPAEKCDIHTEPNLSGIFKSEVAICTDPRHEGKLYRANIPGPLQEGGCPQEYIQKIVLSPGQDLPYCPFPDHQVKKRKVKEVIEDLTR
ncbi:penicillin-binding protein 1A [Thermosyntropha lipolytica DSM 11003]|uniref:Penicillin-binding protein 1A n=1 Tax=Thermosyntropha lipolytica DSM 11003 TaxID=1123382 RepID=A0A1M5K7B0_9FIRM|nr:PBP1A family penicillin-binding protein [Thermosyntropha lipolytica]SHG48712.1 penicillin-binding protein 1A [Thermosyntropha lipolytica DSM 11003]